MLLREVSFADIVDYLVWYAFRRTSERLVQPFHLWLRDREARDACSFLSEEESAYRTKLEKLSLTELRVLFEDTQEENYRDWCFMSEFEDQTRFFNVLSALLEAGAASLHRARQVGA